MVGARLASMVGAWLGQGMVGCRVGVRLGQGWDMVGASMVGARLGHGLGKAGARSS